MPVRDTAPTGAPCWVDLTTSDVGRSRAFYTELFGWTADEPAEEYGGYFTFRKDGHAVAGCMAAEPRTAVPDVWSAYLAADDAQKTVDLAEARGAIAYVPPMPVGDLGTMAFLGDIGGAAVGVWQPGQHRGFGVYAEPGTPTWFELHTRDYDASVAFYRDVFGWETRVESDVPSFRYTTLVDGGLQLAGIMDAGAFLPEGVPAHWSVYFGSADVDATVEDVLRLGGSVVEAAKDTPYGRLVVVADPTGSRFKLVGGLANA